MANKNAKVISKSILKNSDKGLISRELTKRMVMLICRAENSSFVKKE